MLRWVQDTGKGSVQAGGFRALLRKWGCIQPHKSTNLVSEDDACFLEIHVWPFLVLRQAGPFTHWVQEQNIPQTVLCLEYTIKWQSVLKEATHINKKLNTKKQNGTTNTAQHTNSLLTRILRTIKWFQQLPLQSFSSLYLHGKKDLPTWISGVQCEISFQFHHKNLFHWSYICHLGVVGGEEKPSAVLHVDQSVTARATQLCVRQKLGAIPNSYSVFVLQRMDWWFQTA